MKKVSLLLLCLVLVICCVCAFVACDDSETPDGGEHQHTYETGWTSDGTHHWHKATCEHATEVDGKAEHNFGTGNKCTVCDYEKSTEEHKHSFGTAWKSDGTNHWHECSCGEKSGIEAHKEQVISAVPATCTENGLTEGKKCSVCDKVLVEQTTVNKLGHDFTGSWQKGASGHWHVCKNEGCEETDTVVGHTPDNTGKCTVCDYQGKAPSTEIDEEAWQAALAELRNITNFSGSVTMQDGDEFYAQIAQVTKDAIRLIASFGYEDYLREMENYVIFTPDSILTYENVGGVWICDVTEAKGGEFDVMMSELFENYFDFVIEMIIDEFESFTLDSDSNTYVWEAADGVCEVQFDGSSICSLKVVSETRDGTATIRLYDIGETEFEIAPTHKHEFSTEFSANDVYHWHEATCHDGVIDGKTPHDWATGDKCSVCGYAMPETVKSQVTKEELEKALQLDGITSWTYIIRGADGYNAYIKRCGNLIETYINEELSYFEVDEIGVLWQYIEVSEGVWQKVYASDNYNVLSFVEDVFEPQNFARLASWWGNLQYADGAYVGVDLKVADDFFNADCNHATVRIVLSDGEVVLLTITEMDGERSLGTISLENLGTTTVTLPSATVHKHDWSVVSGIELEGHTLICEGCGREKTFEHEFDDKGVCAVCKYFKHTHEFENPGFDEKTHYGECSICNLFVQEEHNFDGDTCTACGYRIHKHVLEVEGFGEDHHSGWCTICKQYLYENHDFGDGDTCSACGYRKHEHVFVLEKGHERYHYGHCAICKMSLEEDHDWDGDTCKVCGYRQHEHVMKTIIKVDEYAHYGYCDICGTDLDEKHDYTQYDEACSVCGVKNHKHEFNWAPDREDPDCHSYQCECGLTEYWMGSREHEFDIWDEGGVCQVCGATYHEHDYKWVEDLCKSSYNWHQMYCAQCGKYEQWSHTFDKDPDHCDVCGAEPHKHQWELMESNIVHHIIHCPLCEESYSEEHTFKENGERCDVCGAERHDHNWIFDKENCWIEANYHYVICTECGSMMPQEHVFKNDSQFCDVCGAERHEHSIDYWDSEDINIHRGWCSGCGEYTYASHEWLPSQPMNEWVHLKECSLCHASIEEDHFWGEDGKACDLCGYEKHVHRLEAIDGYDTDVHWGVCADPDCPEGFATIYQEHIWDETNTKCEICDQAYHVHEWVYDTDRGSISSLTEHALVCIGENCGKTKWEYHVFENNGETCDVCGATKHEHSLMWKDGNNYDYNSHELTCFDGCSYSEWQPHTFELDGVKCDVCDYRIHEHEFKLEGYDHTRHYGRCSICFIYMEDAHDFVDGSCTVCEYPEHEHQWVQENQYGPEYHWGHCCICGMDLSGWHSFEGDDDACIVCGMKNHNHEDFVASCVVYAEAPDYHAYYCECGYFISIESHQWGENNGDCTKCGVTYHKHDYQWTEEACASKTDYNFHYLYCEGCGNYQQWGHFFTVNPDQCDVCGAERHEHSAPSWEESGAREHYARCEVCGEMFGEEHVYDDYFDTDCNICGGDRHYHDVDEWEEHESNHSGWCPNCGDIEEEHVWGEDGSCIVCHYDPNKQ